jgi:K+-transporting ATPase ATPase A chain
MGIDQTPSDLQPGGNMEGKEVRFGIMSSALFSVVTTSASCGAVNSMHDSFTPLGGLVQPLATDPSGSVVSGQPKYAVFVIAMFIADHGRPTPNIWRRSGEMTVTTIAPLVPIFLILCSAIAVLVIRKTAVSIRVPTVFRKSSMPSPLHPRITEALLEGCQPTVYFIIS